MMKIRKAAKQWLLTHLRPNDLMREFWYQYSVEHQTRPSLDLFVRALLWKIVRALWHLTRIPLYMWQLLVFVEELDRLHFSPLKAAKKGRFCVVDKNTWIVNGRNIELGDFIKVSAFSCLMAGQHSYIKIGSNTIIGPNVLIVSFNHGMDSSDVPMRFQPWEDRAENSIHVGSNVWIGANSIVLAGSRIGDGVVVGAGSVVSGVIEPNVVFINPRTTSKFVRGDFADHLDRSS